MKNIATGDVLERIRRLAPSHVTAPFKTVAEWREWQQIRTMTSLVYASFGAYAKVLKLKMLSRIDLCRVSDWRR